MEVREPAGEATLSVEEGKKAIKELNILLN